MNNYFVVVLDKSGNGMLIEAGPWHEYCSVIEAASEQDAFASVKANGWLLLGLGELGEHYNYDRFKTVSNSVGRKIARRTGLTYAKRKRVVKTWTDEEAENVALTIE